MKKRIVLVAAFIALTMNLMSCIVEERGGGYYHHGYHHGYHHHHHDETRVIVR